MTKARTVKLANALREKRIVKFTRPVEDGSVTGYVLDIGERWFMLALVGDGIRFAGFQCLRVSDVRNLEVPHPRAAFQEAALRLRDERRPRKPRVSVANVDALLLSAGRSFPLVTIHREKVDPDSCAIGRVEGVKDGRLSLLEINPDASWDIDAGQYRVRDITRVDFGGDYEDALHLVGGPPPRARRRAARST